MIKLQAREIMCEAKRQGVMPTRQHITCARAIVQKSVGVSHGRCDIGEAANRLGRTYDDLFALECGFEGWDWNPKINHNRYYKVGQRVAELAGLGA
jgi:hypothetical protein